MRKFSLRILSISGSAIGILATGILVTGILAAASPAMAQKETPYWASIDESTARMRTGQSTGYPTMWIYKRKQLPVKVVARYKSWRKVEDPDGTQGWMHARLLTADQTAIVLGKKGQVQVMRSKPDSDAKIIWRVEGGVVGKITDCEGQWCLFDANGLRGYIARDIIWGDEPL